MTAPIHDHLDDRQPDHRHASERGRDAERLVENPHAGKGSSVLLDIGEEVGAIVLTMPHDLIGIEVGLYRIDGHHHQHGGQHEHRKKGHAPHVAVVPRPAADGTTVPSAVFFEVATGRYRLRLLPDGPPRLEVDVIGGEVTYSVWPDHMDETASG